MELRALSSAEMLDQADLVGRAVILSIRRAADDVSPHIARLRFEEITKGKPRGRQRFAALAFLPPTVTVKLPRTRKDANGNAMPGQSPAVFRPGDHVMTHLVWDDELCGYTTLCWSAVWQIPD